MNPTMTYYPRVPRSDATGGSNHSSAIMYIPEPWELNHTPLSRMGTPVDRPGTPFSRAWSPVSDNVLHPNSRNQVLPHRNAPGPLTFTGGTDQFTSSNQAMPYHQALAYPSNRQSGLPHRAEYDRRYSDALQRATEQRYQHRDDHPRDSPPKIRPSHTPSRQPEQMRSSSGILGPAALLGSAFLIPSIGRGSSGGSQRDHCDREI